MKEIYKRLKFTKPEQSGIDLVRNSDKYLAYIDYRIKFEFEMHLRGQNVYHLAPNRGKAIFRTSSFAFGTRKDFPNKENFIRL